MAIMKLYRVGFEIQLADTPDDWFFQEANVLGTEDLNSIAKYVRDCSINTDATVEIKQVTPPQSITKKIVDVRIIEISVRETVNWIDFPALVAAKIVDGEPSNNSDEPGDIRGRIPN